MNSSWLQLPLCLLMAACVFSGQATAEDERDRDRLRDRGGAIQQDRDEGEQGERRDRQDSAGRPREGGIPREQVAQERQQEGTEEGMPQLRTAPGERRVAPYFVPPDRQRWKLGVYAYNTDTGIVITRVVRGSAAQQAGLERGDRIVTIDGYQVGWVEDRLFPLGAELQRRAGRRGDVTLLVQNVRNNRLLNLDLRLDRVR